MQVRWLLQAGDLAEANHQRRLLTYCIDVAAICETNRLATTLGAQSRRRL